MKTTDLALGLVLAVTVSCGSKPKAKTTPDPTPKQTSVTQKQPDKPAVDVTPDQKVSPTLAISGDIVAACGLKVPEGGFDPKFDYDKDELSAEDRGVLDQIATCLMTGALKDKNIALIGRADPRGTEEYNLGLGSRRASSVSTYLARLGVGNPRMAVTTRGAIEATGTDEAGWKKDRRVDIQLAGAPTSPNAGS